VKKLYIWFCDKCNSFVPATCCLATSKKAAWDGGQEHLVKTHDLTHHATDMELFKGRVVILEEKTKK